MGKWYHRQNGISMEAGTYNKLVVDGHNHDINRLTAERDDLRAKLDAVLAMLEPGPAPCDCEHHYHCRCPKQTPKRVLFRWQGMREAHREAKAIAEARHDHDLPRLQAAHRHQAPVRRARGRRLDLPRVPLSTPRRAGTRDVEAGVMSQPHEYHVEVWSDKRQDYISAYRYIWTLEAAQDQLAAAKAAHPDLRMRIVRYDRVVLEGEG